MMSEEQLSGARFEFGPRRDVFEVVHARRACARFPMHAHDRSSVTVVLGNAQRFRLKNDECFAPAGSVLLAAAGEPHANATSDGGAIQYVAVEFELTALGIAPSSRKRTATFESPVVQDPILADALQAVVAVGLGGEPPHTRDARMTGLPPMIRSRLTSFSEIEAARLSVDDRWARCREHMLTHLDQRISLNDLGMTLGLNPDYLCRAFRRDLGMSPYDYLTSLRVDRARALLNSGVRPVEVAFEVGLTDQSHLTRLFKRYYQTTPARFQQHSAATARMRN